MPEEVELEETAEEGDSAYGRRASRLRKRLHDWLAGSPYLRSVSRPIVRCLVEADDMCAELYDQYVSGHDPAVAKLWVAAAQRRERIIKLLGGDDEEGD
jgi:hypothetical protein